MTSHHASPCTIVVVVAAPEGRSALLPPREELEYNIEAPGKQQDAVSSEFASSQMALFNKTPNAALRFASPKEIAEFAGLPPEDVPESPYKVLAEMPHQVRQSVSNGPWTGAVTVVR
jgi:hypothetical protein